MNPPADRPADDADDDRELLRRHAAGDRTAFELLARRHRDRMWAVALRTLGDREEAADALQDALLSAYRAAATFRGEAQVSTWLHRIVVNACLDRVRRRQARPVSQLPADDELPGADDEIERRELRTDLEQALRRLPPEQRIPIVLVDVEGYPVDEVAAMLSVPTGTVKSRCARGRAKLAAMLTTAPTERGADTGTDAGNPAQPAPVQQSRGAVEDVGPGKRNAGRPAEARPKEVPGGPHA